MAMRWFQDIRFFVFCISALYFCDMIGGIYFRSALTTIERRFQLSATKIALVSSASQISNVAVIAFVSYYGSRTHRPRIISIGALSVTLGYIIASLPQFLGGRYSYVDTMQNATTTSSKQAEMCPANNEAASNVTSCEEDSESTYGNNLYVFIVTGLVIAGIGFAPLQPLGVSYMDDYSDPRKSPVYLGITMTIALIAPAFGFLMGAAILRIWVDVGWVDTSEIAITPINPGWVGAWWLGFILVAVLIGVSAVPFFFFPRKMEKIETTESMPEYPFSPGKNETNDEEVENTGSSDKPGIINATKRLIMNEIYVVICVMYVLSSLSIIGVITFFPKYLEVQFGVSASKANMYYGAAVIPCLALGTMLGGFILKRHNPDQIGIIKILFITTIITILLDVALLFLGCGSIDVAGVTTQYTSSVEGASLTTTSTCNAGCGCSNGSFTPICGNDGITYLSPCHAGCQSWYSTIPGKIENYTDCSCINPGNSTETSHWSYPSRCETTKCGEYAILALVAKAFASLVGGIGATPSYVLLLRSVKKRDKSFAMGVSFMATRIMGWVPGPLLFGKAIDSTCLYWAESPCGGRGFCLIYDTDAFRKTFYAMLCLAEILTGLSIIVIYILLKKSKKSTDLENYAVAKEKENEILLKEPSNSFKTAARLASTEVSSHVKNDENDNTPPVKIKSSENLP